MTKVGYLASVYPATSHTFIRREVEALRRHGLAIDTFSIRKPLPEECASAQDRSAFKTTWYVLPASPAVLVLAHLAAIAGRPLAYLRTLRLALRHRVPGLRAMVWSLLHFAESIVLARQLRRQKIDRLHTHFANSGATVGLLASRFLDMPWSLTLHGISETDYPAGLLLAEKIRAAEFVACVSWFGRAQAMRITPKAEWRKLSIVRCGLDLSILQKPIKTRTGPRHRLICVGRLAREKGHSGLLEALATVRARGFDVELVLIGDGPEREALMGEAAALGIAELIDFQGRKDEPRTLAEIARADLLVLPSFMEGLPVVLMEAMALGVPVIASRVAGIPELIVEGREGLLFTPANWSELAERIETTFREYAHAFSRTAAARSKIEREFEITAAVKPLLSLLASDAPDACAERSNDQLLPRNVRGATS